MEDAANQVQDALLAGEADLARKNAAAAGEGVPLADLEAAEEPSPPSSPTDVVEDNSGHYSFTKDDALLLNRVHLKFASASSASSPKKPSSSPSVVPPPKSISLGAAPVEGIDDPTELTVENPQDLINTVAGSNSVDQTEWSPPLPPVGSHIPVLPLTDPAVAAKTSERHSSRAAKEDWRAAVRARQEGADATSKAFLKVEMEKAFAAENAMRARAEVSAFRAVAVAPPPAVAPPHHAAASLVTPKRVNPLWEAKAQFQQQQDAALEPIIQGGAGSASEQQDASSEEDHSVEQAPHHTTTQFIRKRVDLWAAPRADKKGASSSEAAAPPTDKLASLSADLVKQAKAPREAPTPQLPPPVYRKFHIDGPAGAGKPSDNSVLSQRWLAAAGGKQQQRQPTRLTKAQALEKAHQLFEAYNRRLNVTESSHQAMAEKEIEGARQQEQQLKDKEVEEVQKAKEAKSAEAEEEVQAALELRKQHQEQQAQTHRLQRAGEEYEKLLVKEEEKSAEREEEDRERREKKAAAAKAKSRSLSEEMGPSWWNPNANRSTTTTNSSGADGAADSSSLPPARDVFGLYRSKLRARGKAEVAAESPVARAASQPPSLALGGIYGAYRQDFDRSEKEAEDAASRVSARAARLRAEKKSESDGHPPPPSSAMTGALWEVRQPAQHKMPTNVWGRYRANLRNLRRQASLR